MSRGASAALRIPRLRSDLRHVTERSETNKDRRAKNRACRGLDPKRRFAPKCDEMTQPMVTICITGTGKDLKVRSLSPEPKTSDVDEVTAAPLSLAEWLQTQDPSRVAPAPEPTTQARIAALLIALAPWKPPNASAASFGIPVTLLQDFDPSYGNASTCGQLVRSYFNGSPLFEVRVGRRGRRSQPASLALKVNVTLELSPSPEDFNVDRIVGTRAWLRQNASQFADMLEIPHEVDAENDYRLDSSNGQRGRSYGLDEMRDPAIGRDGIFAQLDALLRPGRQDGARRVCLHGLAGIGKTTIALEYAHRTRSFFPGGIYWVNATGEPSDGLVQLGRLLQIDGPEELRKVVLQVPRTEQAEAMPEALIHAFRNFAPPSLLVLDGVDSAGWSKYLWAGNASILITSLEPDLVRSATPISVQSITVDESEVLANRIAGEPANGAEREARRALLDRLAGLPVAVQVVAHTIRATGVGWSLLSSEIAKTTDLLDDSDFLPDYPRGALTAIRSSLRLIRNERAVSAMAVLCAYGSGKIPRRWVVRAAFGKADRIGAAKTLAELEARGVAKAIDDPEPILELHWLVAKLYRDMIPESVWKQSLRRAGRIASGWLFTEGNVARLERWLPLLRRTIDYLEEERITEAYCQLAVSAGVCFHNAGNQLQAGILFERATGAAEELLEKHPFLAASAFAHRANWLSQRGHSSDAENLARRALDISLGTASGRTERGEFPFQSVAIALAALGKGNPNEAIEQLERLLDEAYEAEDSTAPFIAQQLGSLLLQSGNADRAQNVLERGIDTAKSSSKVDPIAVASLESVLAQTHPPTERLLHQQTAWHLVDSLGGASSYEGAVLSAELGQTYLLANDPTAARERLAFALATFDRFQETDTLTRFRVVLLLSVVEQTLGNTDAAEELFSRAVQQLADFRREELTGAVQDLFECASLLVDSSRIRALQCVRHGLDCAKRVFGQAHIRYGQAAVTAGDLACLLNEVDMAIELYRTASSVYKTANASTAVDAFDLIDCKASLGLAQFLAGQPQPAFRTSSSALALLDRMSNFSPDLVESVRWKPRWMLEIFWTDVVKALGFPGTVSVADRDLAWELKQASFFARIVTEKSLRKYKGPQRFFKRYHASEGAHIEPMLLDMRRSVLGRGGRRLRYEAVDLPSGIDFWPPMVVSSIDVSKQLGFALLRRVDIPSNIQAMLREESGVRSARFGSP